MNKIVLRYLLEKGYNQIVGVINHHDVGQDAGEVAGLEKLNIVISAESEIVDVIERTKPNVCILATRSFLNELASVLRIFSAYGVNTITMGEEAFYAWNTSPDICQELDEKFKLNNCTFTATGAQDIFWGYLPAILVGTSHKIKRMLGLIQFNVDDYGRALCEAHGVGLTQVEFKRQFESNHETRPSYIWNSNEWICSYFGWQLKKNEQKLLPIVCSKNVNSKSFGTVIKAGDVIGMKAVVTTITCDGIEIETTMISQVYFDDMVDICSWKLVGEPETEIVIKRPATVEVACAAAVNRIEQVVNANPGYVTTDKLGPISWKFH
ncbi:hypothetical protein I4U23_022862 [Adineta vaga]|nr:hypothetical protein I4U23_022862 [Adineta vaga]